MESGNLVKDAIIPVNNEEMLWYKQQIDSRDLFKRWYDKDFNPLYQGYSMKLMEKYNCWEEQIEKHGEWDKYFQYFEFKVLNSPTQAIYFYRKPRVDYEYLEFNHDSLEKVKAKIQEIEMLNAKE